MIRDPRMTANKGLGPLSLSTSYPYYSSKIVLTIVPSKMDGRNTILSFWDDPFSGRTVSFREGNCCEQESEEH